MLLLNAFSLNMVGHHLAPSRLSINPITMDTARKLATSQLLFSYVGHEGTAALFGELLDMEVPFNRGTVHLHHEPALVGQYSGPRLPEGTTELPEGAAVRWYLVKVEVMHLHTDACHGEDCGGHPTDCGLVEGEYY